MIPEFEFGTVGEGLGVRRYRAEDDRMYTAGDGLTGNGESHGCGRGAETLQASSAGAEGGEA
jgi:hypothetical protein